jgi:RNA polymerase sigma-70 factor (sigma-E family)
VGDDTSYVEFVTGRWPALFRLSYLLTGAHEPAEDLLQSVLMKAYASWGRIHRMESPDAYIRRMLVNGAISAGTRGWRREHPTEQVPETARAGHEQGYVDRAALWPVVQTLPPRQRAVVVLRYYEDLSEAQTAEVMDCAVGTVKSQVSQGLRRLREQLGADAARLLPTELVRQ